MSIYRFTAKPWKLLFTLVALLVFLPTRAFAVDADSDLDGHVLFGDKPVVGASVTATHENDALKTQTDINGKFHFESVEVGEYIVRASKDGLTGDVRVTVPVSGIRNVEIHLAAPGQSSRSGAESPREIARVTSSAPPPSAASGTSVTVNGTQMQHNTAAQNFSRFLAQMPAAVSGINGRVYINGSPNGVSYTVDGARVPASLSRVLPGAIDADDVAYANVTEGAFPASVGGRFGAAITIATKLETGPPAFGTQLTGGSLATLGNEFFYRASLNGRGALSFGARVNRSDWVLDPPTLAGTHDAGSIDNELLRGTFALGTMDDLDFVVNQTYQMFQIPTIDPSGAGGGYQNQSDSFAALHYRRSTSPQSVLSLGLTSQHTRTNDDSTLQVSPLSCALTGGDCVYGFAGQRNIASIVYDAAYANRTAKHDVRAGLSASPTHVSLVPLIVTNADGTVSFTNAAARTRFDFGAYVQDDWQVGSAWSLEYGLRDDRISVIDGATMANFGQISPRIKLTRTLTARSSIYAYYGRLFEPYAPGNYFEAAPDSVGIPFMTTARLQPESDSLYEIGGHVPLGKANLGVRFWHKVEVDALDETLIPNTNVE